MDTQIKEAQGIPRRDAPAPPELPQETLWSRLYQSHCARMFRIARQITQNDAEAEDAVQQAFVRLLSALDTAPDPDSPQTRALLSIVTERSAISGKTRGRFFCLPVQPRSMLDLPISVSLIPDSKAFQIASSHRSPTRRSIS
ncbi:MAG: sigma-70 family RNA polymerase sigma factor [Oscillospiraceae bacterium]|nr:sigma-70 family RNA polymerase sigma factor [Oscillospiraceae bacterium]